MGLHEGTDVKLCLLHSRFGSRLLKKLFISIQAFSAVSQVISQLLISLIKYDSIKARQGIQRRFQKERTEKLKEPALKIFPLAPMEIKKRWLSYEMDVCLLGCQVQSICKCRFCLYWRPLPGMFKKIYRVGGGSRKSNLLES